MRIMKLSIIVIPSFVLVCFAAENRKIDELQYKNHKLTKNETLNPSNKFSVYPAQVYADLSNIKDSITTNQPKITETLSDEVRVFVSSSISKKRQNLTMPIVQASTISSTFQNSPLPMNYVTAMNAAKILPTKDSKTPIYSPSYPNNVKETVDFRTTTISEDISIRNQGLRTQNQAQTHLLYATTQIPMVSKSKDTTTFARTTKVSSNNSSKPFTTVLVPKQMLNGDSIQQNYKRDDFSFRPIVPPVFTYTQNTDTNSIENRRSTNVVKTESTSKSPKYNPVKVPATYKVEEYIPTDQSPSIVLDRSFNTKNTKLDVFNPTYVSDERPVLEKSKRDKMKYESSREIPDYDSLKQGYSNSESFKYENQPFKSASYSADQFSEFYPATEKAPSKESYMPYNMAEKFEMARPPPSFEKPSRPLIEYSSPPQKSWYSSINTETKSRNPEFPIDEANAKDVLKSLLLDMLKSKQQAEIKPKSSNMNEFIDSYFKTHRPNVDYSLENYDIETDMSCNLRSSKYITDGHCVSVKPIVEAVCADRCLVYSPIQPPSTQRQRLTSSASQQVEALHCIDGDIKLLRIQLKCKDGNTLNNVIKVVTNCQCKLHQIQPQMRSNRQA